MARTPTVQRFYLESMPQLVRGVMAVEGDKCHIRQVVLILWLTGLKNDRSDKMSITTVCTSNILTYKQLCGCMCISQLYNNHMAITYTIFI